MSVGGKVRFLGFLIRDYLKNSKDERVFAQWKDIEETLSDYNTGWKKVEKSLQDCLDYATEHCEFYKQYKGKPLSEFPILTKMDFIENYEKIKNPLFQEDKLHTMSTSGSTGTPFRVVQNKAKRNRVIAELKYFGNIAGYPSHEKMIFYRACHQIPFLTSFFTNVWQPDVSILSNEQLVNLHKFQKRAKGIMAYASTIGNVVLGFKKLNLKGSDIVRVVITGSEILTKETRELCKSYWKNSNVVSRFSNQENGILAQECNGLENQYICNWSSYYFEVLKLNSNEPADEGELGRLVITDLHNKAFPMIRYDNGDIVRLKKESDSFPQFIDVQGRRVDMIFDSKGTPLSPHVVTNLMWGVKGNISQWQFIQEGAKKYRIVYCAPEKSIATQALYEKLDKLKNVFGHDAIFELEYVNEIPVLRSGKRKMIVQKFWGGVNREKGYASRWFVLSGSISKESKRARILYDNLRLSA